MEGTLQEKATVGAMAGREDIHHRKRLACRTSHSDEWRDAVAAGDAARLSDLVLSAADCNADIATTVVRDCLASLEKKRTKGTQPSCTPFSGKSLMTASGAANNGCILGALAVVLRQSCEGKSWCTSTMQLQLASLQFCIVSRDVPTMRLMIRHDTPYRLLSPTHAASPQDSRVPRPRFLGVAWNCAPAVAAFVLVNTFADAESFSFGYGFNDEGLENVSWPSRVRVLHFGPCFNQKVEGMSWPASLERLTFGDRFNHPIETVTWPGSLQVLDFGLAFNQVIEEVMWPVSLQRLSFGERFNQPIEAAVWPSSLQHLWFGERFNQPIERATWPSSLRKLFLGGLFNQPVRGVRWPTSLRDLMFGYCRNDESSASGGFDILASFNHPIDGVAWPASLRRLTLGDQFRQSLQGLGSWMPQLEELRLFHYGNSDYHDLLTDIEWPSALRQLTVFEDALLENMVIPESVTIAYQGSW